jgi:hypothetical protein
MKTNQSFDKLYKFRSWSHAGHRCNFENRVLDFPSPDRFNDPFDCDIPWAYDKMSRAERAAYLWSLRRQFEPNEDELTTAASVQVIEQQMDCDNPDRFAEYIEKYVDVTKSQYGILSFAGTVDNILLWSHYADDHRGFCLEFDRAALDQMFLRLLKEDRHSINGFSVTYVDEYPILFPKPDSGEGWYKRFTHKSNYWKYEREYRYIYSSGANLSRYFPLDALTAVYLGCRMEEDALQDVRRIAQQVYPHARIFRAKKKFRRFELEFELL